MYPVNSSWVAFKIYRPVVIDRREYMDRKIFFLFGKRVVS